LNPKVNCDTKFSMNGHIRTQEKCPVARANFRGHPCAASNARPCRATYSLIYGGREKGTRFLRAGITTPWTPGTGAYRLLTTIRESIDRGQFDPRDFVRKEIKHLVFENYGLTWLERRQNECERQQLAKSTFKQLKGAMHNYFIPFFKGKNLITKAHATPWPPRLSTGG
jgi:hypothetical protein